MYDYLIQEAAVMAPITNVKEKNPNIVEFVAVLQTADEKNRNGRIYPRKVLEEALKAPYVQNMLANKTLYGEAGHPMDMNIRRQATICQSNIAFLIDEVWWEGNNIMGRCETADTAIGRDMAGLIKQHSRVAFSLRAQGKVHTDPMGTVIVESPLNIVTWDWVVNPSHAGAYLQSVCEETLVSLVRPMENKTSEMALCEAANIFNNGNIVEINETAMPTIKDYYKLSNVKTKTPEQCYIYSPSDKISSVSDDKRSLVLIRENGEYAKVSAEDYFIKDIRNKITEL